VLTAEVRLLQAGNGQITRSMYRQLDEVTFVRFEPFGRVRDNELNPREGVVQLVGRDTDTKALVRYNANPPNWSTREGPSEFSHWLEHTRKPDPYAAAEGPDGHRVLWTRGSSRQCPERPNVRFLGPGDAELRTRSEEPSPWCSAVDLVEVEQTWRAKARAQLAELLEAQAEYDRFKALPLIVLPD
jgi:hypothetical protein